MIRVVRVWCLWLIAAWFAWGGEPAPTAAECSSVVSVLAYEHVAAPGEAGGLTAEAFARQLDYLLQSGLTPISAERFLAWRAGREALPPHAVLLTLEEADDVTYERMYPLLKERGIPFVLFVDHRNVENGTHHLRPEQIREMQQHGAAVGSATATRPAGYEWQFASIKGEEAALIDLEIGAFGESIRRLFGSCELLSYPYGYSDAAMRHALAPLGFQAAFGREAGKVSLRSPAAHLPRNMVHSDTDFARAVNFGKEEETPALLAQLTGQEPVRPNAQPGYTSPFADDDEAEEAEESETAAAAVPAAQVLETPHAVLARSEGGDWVTTRFAAPLVPREQTRVAVLGYHNFSKTAPVSEMRMRTAEFCGQMQYIREAGLCVITMEDFLQWLRGDRQLPERCVLITLDDGWRSVYTDAYPIMRAYGYPFTLFLYTRYIQVQGSSLTKAQIREMLEQGGTVGSHSVSHLYPRSWRRLSKNGEAYAQQVQREIIGSQDKLEDMFGTCSTYCYPGGYNTPPMLEALRASRFRAAFTVLEAKVTTEEDPYLVHRYMVFGNNPSIFRRAVNFDGQTGVQPAQEGIRAAAEHARDFFPEAFETGHAPIGE